MTEPGSGTPSHPHPNTAHGAHLDSPSPAPQAPPRPVELIARAKDQLRLLTGYRVDSVSGFTKSDSGWHLSVMMVELPRIPPVTDVLAGYEVELDTAGDIISYQRGRRYFRGQLGDGT